MGKCEKLPIECPDGCGAIIARIKVNKSAILLLDTGRSHTIIYDML